MGVAWNLPFYIHETGAVGEINASSEALLSSYEYACVYPVFFTVAAL